MKYLNLLAITAIVLASCSKHDTEKLKKEIIDADKAFSTLSAEKGMKVAFFEYLDENCIVLKPNHYPIIGLATYKELYKNVNDSSFSLTWEPIAAEVSLSGDMGFSYGTWKLTTEDETGEGSYCSFWRKNKDGKWKLIMDAGNDGLGNDKESE